MTGTTLSSTKAEIVTAAERLFALHGIDGVSLRQIGAAAGAANNSVVQYHFGSKDRLVDAVIEYRLPALHARRTQLLERHRAGDLRSLLKCQALAILEQGEQPGSHYLSFIATLRQQGHQELLDRLPEEVRASLHDFHQRLGAHLPHLPEHLRAHRLARAMTLIVQTAADRERARFLGRVVPPFGLELADLVDSLVGSLLATPSPESLAPLAEDEAAGVAWPPFI
ncbi:TetR/AcrR family transcriptional regulator [Streptomyces fuscichromogenes]|uniref:TetR/AcrR family transcriptional regulator n=1 Tax=Streptomyces fuscichromogenes TaxID=1324013 RepID=UPI0038078CDC